MSPLEPEDLDAQAEAAAFDEAESLEVTDEPAADTVAIKEEP